MARLTFDPGDDNGRHLVTGWIADCLQFDESRSGRPAHRHGRRHGGDELVFRADRPCALSDGLVADGGISRSSRALRQPRISGSCRCSAIARPIAFANTAFIEDGPSFSPDGRWLAYSSNESGALQVYVQPFPPTGRKSLVSRNGGGQPLWRADGRELYFLAARRDAQCRRRDGGRSSKAAFPHGSSILPLATNFAGRRQYAVTGDGKQFLFIAPPASAESTPIMVVTNFRPNR